MREPLLHRIERYLKLTGIRPTPFGRAAARDPTLVFGLRRGRALRPPTEAKVRAYLNRAERQLREGACRRRRP